MKNKKEAIGLWIRDREGKKKEIEVDIDIEAWNDFESMEKQLLEFTDQGALFLVEEGIKKNRKFWWQKQWKRLKTWLKMALRRSG